MPSGSTGHWRHPALVAKSCRTSAVADPLLPGNPAELRRRSWPLHSNRVLVRQVAPLAAVDGRRLALALCETYDRDISEQQIDELVRLSGGSPLHH